MTTALANHSDMTTANLERKFFCEITANESNDSDTTTVNDSDTTAFGYDCSEFRANLEIRANGSDTTAANDSAGRH